MTCEFESSLKTVLHIRHSDELIGISEVQFEQRRFIDGLSATGVMDAREVERPQWRHIVAAVRIISAQCGHARQSLSRSCDEDTLGFEIFREPNPNNIAPTTEAATPISRRFCFSFIKPIL